MELNEASDSCSHDNDRVRDQGDVHQFINEPRFTTHLPLPYPITILPSCNPQDCPLTLERGGSRPLPPPLSLSLDRSENLENFSRRHRCPHNLVAQDHLEIPRDEPVHAVTSYREEFDEKRVDRQTVYHHEDHLRMEGDFVGERRTDYVATRGERAPVRRPQDNLRPEGEFVGRPKEEAPKKGDRAAVTRPRDNLRPEGEFDSEIFSFSRKNQEKSFLTFSSFLSLAREGTTTTELVFTGTPGERPSPIRRNTYTKVEGEFVDSTTTRSEYVDHRTVQRAEIVKRADNLTVGEGEFTVSGGKLDRSKVNR